MYWPMLAIQTCCLVDIATKILVHDESMNWIGGALDSQVGLATLVPSRLTLILSSIRIEWSYDHFPN